MTELDRIKLLVSYLVKKGIAANQREFGKLMGYSSESSFSQILNGKVPLPKKFISKLRSIEPDINMRWVTTGEGNILLSDEPHINNIRSVGEVTHNGVATLGDRSPVIKDVRIDIEDVTNDAEIDAAPNDLLKYQKEIKRLGNALVDAKIEISRLEGRIEEKENFIKLLMDKR